LPSTRIWAASPSASSAACLRRTVARSRNALHFSQRPALDRGRCPRSGRPLS
jgi:hypothetical protein